MLGHPAFREKGLAALTAHVKRVHQQEAPHAPAPETEMDTGNVDDLIDAMGV